MERSSASALPGGWGDRCRVVASLADVRCCCGGSGRSLAAAASTPKFEKVAVAGANLDSCDEVSARVSAVDAVIETSGNDVIVNARTGFGDGVGGACGAAGGRDAVTCVSSAATDAC